MREERFEDESGEDVELFGNDDEPDDDDDFDDYDWNDGFGWGTPWPQGDAEC